MKTFNDLEFKDHVSKGHGFDTYSQLDFDNGYGVSVITGSYGYGSGKYPYEITILYKGKICYSIPLTDDKIGNNNEQYITDIMQHLQELQP